MLLQDVLTFCQSLIGWPYGLREITRAVTSPTFEERCNTFRPETHIVPLTGHVVEYLPRGKNLTIPDAASSCNRPYQVITVNLCRIRLSVRTSENSFIDMEAWLPENWTGRFLGTGNGGLDGCIHYEDLTYGSEHGFATVGSNGGHDGNTALPLYRNLEKVVDYAWRGLHTSVIIGKEIAKHFYREPHTKSYFIGCSFGGRQGIDSADRFSEDFDGIVTGAPAVDFNNLVSWRAHFLPITGPTGSAEHIPLKLWNTVIHDEVLAQCDGLDGVLDGIIEDVSQCDFRAEVLQCSSNSQKACLTPVQVETVQKIFSPLLGNNGEVIFPAMNPGNELLAAERFYAGKPFRYSEEWFKYVVHGPSWDPLTFNSKDAAAAESLNPGNIRTWPGNLTGFKARSGKIIMYHGGQDEQITSFNTERFYRHLSREMEMPPVQLDEFLRFFRISGMFHCSRGPGAWAFGQPGAGAALGGKGVPFRRENNVLAAIVDWVEKGIAPEVIEGIKFINDTVDLGIYFRRRHCRVPFRNTYLGGDSKAHDAWQCRKIEHWGGNQAWYSKS